MNDISYTQFDEALQSLGFVEKASNADVIVYRHPGTNFLVALPPGEAEDIVPPPYQEVARRTIALRGIATERQIAQAFRRTLPVRSVQQTSPSAALK